MKIDNTTTVPTNIVRDIVRFVKPSTLTRFNVMLKNSRGAYRGRAYTGGSSYHKHGYATPFVVVRIGDKKYPMYYRPYQYGQLKDKKYPVFSRTEMVLLVLAHELRHLAQKKMKRGYYWGSRGRYSEIDADCYAITCLRGWRKKWSE